MIRSCAAVTGAVLFMACAVLFLPGEAHAQLYDNTEPDIDFSDVSGEEDLPEELRGNALTEDLQTALQEAMRADQTDPEEQLDKDRLSGDSAGTEDDAGSTITDPTDGSSIVLFGDAEAVTFNTLNLTEHPPLSVSYDAERKRFVYEFPNGAKFSMTAPLGGMSNEPVSLEAGEGMELLELWLDDVSLLEQIAGDALEDSNAPDTDLEKKDIGAEIRDESVMLTNRGLYQFTVFSDGVSNGAADDSYLLRGSVQILGYDEKVSLHYIGTPPGLALSLFTCNGEKLDVDSPYGVSLVKDGSYRMIYTLGKTEWGVTFGRDTTPPMLLFSVPLGEEKIKSEVSWQIYRPDTEVTVYRNNMAVQVQGNTVYDDGQYRVQVSDSAGNVRVYRFVIAKGMRIHPEVYLMGLGVLIIVSALVILVYRRRLTVI